MPIKRKWNAALFSGLLVGVALSKYRFTVDLRHQGRGRKRIGRAVQRLNQIVGQQCPQLPTEAVRPPARARILFVEFTDDLVRKHAEGNECTLYALLIRIRIDVDH